MIIKRIQNVFTKNKTPRQKLVILGTGWAGTSCHKYINKNLYDVIIVSPRNYFLFTPLLASTTTGTLNHTSIIDPVRQRKFRHTQDYKCAKVQRIDTDKKELTLKSVLVEDENVLPTFTMSYDKLVIGVGAVTNTFNIPGVEEYAYFLKDIAHSVAIKKQLSINLEVATNGGSGLISPAEIRKRLHVIIVGGGPTGIEFGAEVYDFMKADIKKKFPDIANHVRVSIIDAGKILSMFDEGLQNKAQEKIRKRANFQLFEDTGVIKVDADGVHLSDGSIMKSGLVVWSTGLKANPLFKNIGNIELNRKGYIHTDKQFETNIPDIFAIGDCADVDNQNLMQTAQQAEQQGKYLSKEILNKPDLKKQDREPYKFVFRGVMAYIGGYRAMVQAPNSINGKDISKVSPRWEGIHGLIAWRSAYWTMLGRWHLRFQVPFDWFKSFCFGRDSSIFIGDKRPIEFKKEILENRKLEK